MELQRDTEEPRSSRSARLVSEARAMDPRPRECLREEIGSHVRIARLLAKPAAYHRGVAIEEFGERVAVAAGRPNDEVGVSWWLARSGHVSPYRTSRVGRHTAPRGGDQLLRRVGAL